MAALMSYGIGEAVARVLHPAKVYPWLPKLSGDEGLSKWEA